MLVLVIALLLVRPWSTDGDQVTVPAVTDMSATQAESALSNLDLRVNRLQEPNNDVPSGSPTRTAPAEGVSVDKGSTITLYISSGPQRQDLPDLIGKSEDEAKKILNDLGFTDVKTGQIPSSNQLRGKVAGLSPQSGTSQSVNTTVTIQIGTGPRQVSVPTVTGQTSDEAQQTLENARLRIQTQQADSEQAAGTVLSSSPTAGTQVDEGSVVTVTVSRGNQFRMPDLTGKTVQQAQDTLAAAGWKDTTLNQVPRNVGLGSPDAGRVISQNPPTNSV